MYYYTCVRTNKLESSPGRTQREATGGLAPQWLHDSPQLTILLSGETTLSAENSGESLGSRGSVPNPTGSSQRSPDRLAGGRGLLPRCFLPRNPTPALGLRPFGILPPIKKILCAPLIQPATGIEN